MMNLFRNKLSAFSLLEVIIAVAIFAGAVTAMLGLLPLLTRQSMTSADTLSALRLSDALRVELTRMATAGGFNALAGQTRPLTALLPETCLLVATRNAAQLHSLVYQSPPAAGQIREDSQYFLIEAWSFNVAPLAFESSGAVLALHVRVSWPYRVPGSLAVTPIAGRETVGFNLAIPR